MAAAVDHHLEQLGAADALDRRNGSSRRHLLTTLGDIEVCVPRRFSPTAVIRCYVRREPEIDRYQHRAACAGSADPPDR